MNRSQFNTLLRDGYTLRVEAQVGGIAGLVCVCLEKADDEINITAHVKRLRLEMQAGKSPLWALQLQGESDAESSVPGDAGGPL